MKNCPEGPTHVMDEPAEILPTEHTEAIQVRNSSVCSVCSVGKMLGLLGALVLSVAEPALGAAAPVQLSAGAASADITPDTRMRNTFYPQPWGSVRDPIFARAFVLSDATTRVVFIGWDLVDAREYAVARVRQAVMSATGIPEDHIVLHATHYHSGPKSEMGPEPLAAFERKAALPAQQDPLYKPWADKLVETCVTLVRDADRKRQPVTLAIGRAYIGEVLFNRRPEKPDGTVQTMMLPPDPYVLAKGLRFGKLDPTLTVLAMRNGTGDNVATLVHLAAHAVSIYGGFKGISADWPGAVVNRFKEGVGGEPFVLQGCAGDIVPWRRGPEAVEHMSKLIWERGAAALKVAEKLEAARLRTSRAILGLPASPQEQAASGRITLPAEVQVVTCGPLALVTLPGEPLNELGVAIQERSPFPHTLVLGYSNGRGATYVGLPGKKWKGGYEMSHVGTGGDEVGQAMVDSAIRLLKEHAALAQGR